MDHAMGQMVFQSVKWDGEQPQCSPAACSHVPSDPRLRNKNKPFLYVQNQMGPLHLHGVCAQPKVATKTLHAGMCVEGVESRD